MSSTTTLSEAPRTTVAGGVSRTAVPIEGPALPRLGPRARIEVVPADEAARLASRSVTRNYDPDDQLTATVDIGGGSAEVTLAATGVVDQVVSLPLGAVRLSERYSKSDPLKPKHWKA